MTTGYLCQSTQGIYIVLSALYPCSESFTAGNNLTGIVFDHVCHVYLNLIY
jgi:hypothetical protein